MKDKMCEHWYEEEFRCGLREICRGNNNKNCTCSGVKKQCNYPEFFKEAK